MNIHWHKVFIVSLQKIRRYKTNLASVLIIDTVFYGCVNALSRIFSFLIFPLLARALSASDFAIFDFYYMSIVLSLSFLTFGTESLLLRRLPQMRSELNKKN